MNLEPVKTYKAPKYPEKSTALSDPGILKNIPDRWKDNITVGVALSSIVALTLTGCGINQVGKDGISSGSGNGASNITASAATNQETQQKIQGAVAPIFDHGNGRGSFGCSSVAPPSFLSEEEAFQVIQQEAAKYGITFKKNAYELENVDIPETKLFLKPEDGSSLENNIADGEINSTKKGKLRLDGYAGDKKIGFEFISNDDYKQWVKAQKTYSSVEDYDFITTAKLLQKGLANKKQDTNIGVFYNPMTPYREIKDLVDKAMKVEAYNTYDFDDVNKKTMEFASENLKLQVKDFFEWLKAQGVI
jgi:hypothetical protein